MPAGYRTGSAPHGFPVTLISRLSLEQSGCCNSAVYSMSVSIDARVAILIFCEYLPLQCIKMPKGLQKSNFPTVCRALSGVLKVTYLE